MNTDLQLKKFPVKWFINDQELSKRDDDYRIISSGIDHSLTIRRCKLEQDKATILATCSNQEIEAKLFVKEKDAVFDEPLPSELKLKTEQEQAKLRCVTNVAKNVELKWTKGSFFVKISVLK